MFKKASMTGVTLVTIALSGTLQTHAASAKLTLTPNPATCDVIYTQGHYTAAAVAWSVALTQDITSKCTSLTEYVQIVDGPPPSSIKNIIIPAIYGSCTLKVTDNISTGSYNCWATCNVVPAGGTDIAVTTSKVALTVNP